METDWKGTQNTEDISNLKKKKRKTAEPWHIIIENYSKQINSIIEISKIDRSPIIKVHFFINDQAAGYFCTLA